MQKQTIMHKKANRYEHQIPMFSFAQQSVSPKFEIRDVEGALISPLNLQKTPLPGWVYPHISNAMQYSNTALKPTAVEMHGSNTFFYVVTHFLMVRRIS